MNSIIENIKSRRSIRSYLDKPVPKEIIDKIIEAGAHAPSSLNSQPWEFTVITDKISIEELRVSIRKTIKKILALSPLLKIFAKDLRNPKAVAALRKTAESNEDTIFYGAPCVIIISSKYKDKWTMTDCSLAAGNIMLSAHSLGLGTCFIGRILFLKYDKQIMRKAGLDIKGRLYACLSLGYPKETPNIPLRKNMGYRFL